MCGVVVVVVVHECVHASMCACVYLCACRHVCMHVCVHMHVRVCVCVCVCVCVFAHVCTCVYACMSVYICACVYMHVCVCVSPPPPSHNVTPSAARSPVSHNPSLPEQGITFDIQTHLTVVNVLFGTKQHNCGKVKTKRINHVILTAKMCPSMSKKTTTPSFHCP